MIFSDWLLTPHRVAIHRPTKTAVVADLHLGYQQARRQSGDAVPLVDAKSQLAPLILALEQWQATSVVIAGDLFEKAFDPLIWHDLQSALRTAAVHFHGLIPGNHDRGLEHAPPDLPLLPAGLTLGGWRVLHGTDPLPDEPLVLGDFHPSVTYRGRKIPCYMAAPRRLILPAYSKDAAGGNVRSAKTWHGYRCLGIASGRVIEVNVSAAR